MNIRGGKLNQNMETDIDVFSLETLVRSCITLLKPEVAFRKLTE
jgi:hypothetical protein